MDQTSKPQKEGKGYYDPGPNAHENFALATSQHEGPEIKRYEKGVFQISACFQGMAKISRNEVVMLFIPGSILVIIPDSALYG